MACSPGFGGGPGWKGSPSNLVRITTGEVVVGTIGADNYVRPSRAQNDRSAGARDGHGGFGPGQTSGGQGGAESADSAKVTATAGESQLASGRMAVGGAAGTDPVDRSVSGDGGGGGASGQGVGGTGGGESLAGKDVAPTRGTLGGGGGGGEGSSLACNAGGQGGNGYVAFRMN
jgi:hypothetical protein